MHTFVINLDRHPERLAFVTAELAKIGLQGERISACDGRDIDIPLFAAPYFARAEHLSPFQIACSISHMETWRQIIVRDIDAALILEDDAVLAADLPRVLNDVIDALPADWELVRLCRAPKRAVKPLAMLWGGRRLVRYSRIPLGRAGYLISNAGARKLLKPRQIVRPGDVEIAHPWLLNLNVYGVDPPPIAQERRALPSTIGDQRGDISKVARSRPSVRRVIFNMQKIGVGWWFWLWCRNVMRGIAGRPTF